MMPDQPIWEAFIACAIKNAGISGLNISDEKVRDEVMHFLRHIEAPTDLRGFFFVSYTVQTLLALEGKSITEQFQLRPYLVEALKTDLSPFLNEENGVLYKSKTKAPKWPADHPFYMLLFVGTGLKNTQLDQLFFKLFCVHYVENVKLLKDPDLQPNKHSRTEEVCRAFRKIQHNKQSGFNVTLILNQLTNWTAGDLAYAFDSYINEGGGYGGLLRYVQSLVKFFSNGWTIPNLRGGGGPSTGRRSGSQGRDTVVPEVPQLPTRKAMVEPPEIQSDEHGIVVQDVEVLRTHIAEAIEEQPDREPAEVSSVCALFDEDLKALDSIDITRNLRKKNNLNLSSRLLLSPGSIHLLHKICESRMERKEDHEPALAICCMLSTGISLSELVKFRILHDANTQKDCGIVINEGQCFWQMKHRMSSSIPLGDPTYFYPCDEWVQTPCSDTLQSYITAKRLKATALFEQSEQVLRKRIDKLLQRTTEKFRVAYISIEMIETFLARFTEAAETIDPVVLDFSYQQQLYSTRVSRSYVNLSDAQRTSMLGRLWCDVATYAQNPEIESFFRPTILRKDHVNRVGSRFVPKEDFCQRFVAQLQKSLVESVPKANLSLSQIVQYHNAFIRYIAWMLGFGSGYRAVINPLPTLALHAAELNLLCISDKDDQVFSHSRIVVLPERLNQQLLFLKSHLMRLAELLAVLSPELYRQIKHVLNFESKLMTMSAAKAKKWFLSIRNQTNELGPLFYLDENLNAKTVKPAWLKSGNGDFAELPVNLGRHWLKSALVIAAVPNEIINCQMGHWQEGQSPLFQYSTINMTECVEYLAPIIDELMADQGWQACKSALI